MPPDPLLDTVAVAVPSSEVPLSSLHVTGVAVQLTSNNTAWSTVAVQLPSHPFESVTTTVYVPAGKPVAVAVVCPAASFHK